MPAKSGNEENSIEKETNDFSNGALALEGGVADNEMGTTASATDTKTENAANRIDAIVVS